MQLLEASFLASSSHASCTQCPLHLCDREEQDMPAAGIATTGPQAVAIQAVLVSTQSIDQREAACF